MREKVHLYIFFVLMAVAVWLFGKILWPYITVIAISVVLAVLAYPLCEWLRKYVRWGWLASLATLIVIVVVILLPLAAFGTLVVEEAIQLVGQLRADEGSAFAESVNGVARSIEAIVPGLTVDVRELANQGFSLLTGNITSIFSSALHALASTLIGLILLYYLLKDGEYFKKEIVEKSPLGKGGTKKILDTFKLTIESVIRGNLLMALVQGVLTGVGFWIFGVPNAALWAGVAAIMALIPVVGTTLVLLGGLIFIFVNAGFGLAIGFLAYSAVVVGLIDDVLRPYLIGRRAHIHPLLVLLSVVGGLAAFGIAGFILGPIILALFIAVFEMYDEVVEK